MSMRFNQATPQQPRSSIKMMSDFFKPAPSRTSITALSSSLAGGDHISSQFSSMKTGANLRMGLGGYRAYDIN
jgi:hypothetical protein